MEIQDLKRLIKKQKLNKDSVIYNIIDLKFFQNSAKCNICNKSIFYEDSSFKINRSNVIEKIGKSDKLTKLVNDTVYSLCICEQCLSNKFPEYTLKTKNRVFNTLSDITCFAFNISEQDKQSQRKKLGITLENSIKRHGEIKGKIIFDNYCEKQSISNKFEYKRDKYNWTKEKFDEFNKSRAITEKNLIKKYGEIEGKQKFDNYRKVQKVAGNTVEYFIDKYGYSEGIKKYSKLCSMKGITLENMIRVYGNTEGPIRYKNFIDKTTTHLFSNISQECLKSIDASINELNYTTYYATKNKEYGKLLNSLGKYVKLDYFIKELNLCIEFNGDLYHANPLIYKSTDKPWFLNKKLTANDIWKNDELRYKTLLNEYNIKTIVIWESDYLKNKELTINNIKQKIWEFHMIMNLNK